MNANGFLVTEGMVRYLLGSRQGGNLFFGSAVRGVGWRDVVRVGSRGFVCVLLGEETFFDVGDFD
jgi:hypothetical protein